MYKYLVFSLLLSLNVIAKDAKKGTMVNIKTNLGDIKVELFDKKAPETVKNFLKYVESKKYNDTIFHRVIDGFMIQGGGFNAKMNRKQTFKSIKNEADNGVSNVTGTIAMARTSDINSATNQFFINVNDNKFLDHQGKDAQKYGYAVFGKVVNGMSVVNRIKKTKTGNQGIYRNKPLQDITIKTVEIVKK